MIQRFHQFRRWAGVDRAVFFANAAQLLRLITGPITMVLVLRYLTPEIQGYFYAFAGVVATQIFLEMGFSQNILQFASHEFAKLHLTPAGKLEGDAVALSRLVSLGRLAFKYYAVAAVIFFLAVGAGGQFFFTVSTAHAATGHPVAWVGAWWLVAAAAAGSLLINPAWALLEGCNQIALTSKFRFWSALGTFSVNALALMLGAGIYVTAIGSLFGLLLAVGYLLWRWRNFLACFRIAPTHGHVSWRHEIWPFQWRIAVSWMSGYFIFDIINPIAFYFCGPVEAGRLGMSNQMVRIIYSLAMAWGRTKAPRFGMLIARRAWAELDALWWRSSVQSVVICLLGLLVFFAGIPFIGLVLPQVPTRLAGWPVNAWLAAAMLVQVPIESMSLELRAHKREPYMWLSVGGAVLTLLFMLVFVRNWGIGGQAAGFALANALSLVPAWLIYRVKRLDYRRLAEG